MNKAITRTAQGTVALLATIAATLSYDHMRRLAEIHGETGWRAHTFPLSVDGLEIIATLVLLATHHTHRRARWLPWTALAIGTAASLTANIAEAPPDLISRTIAGWPAIALTAATKLLTTLLTPARLNEAKGSPAPEATPSKPPRLPKTPQARLTWQRIWEDHLDTAANDVELSHRHHITDRQARTILAAGRAGHLGDDQQNPP